MADAPERSTAGARLLPGRRRILLTALALIALPAGVTAASLILASDRLDHPVVTAWLTLLAAWAFVAGGLVASASRPDNRTGALMVLTGFLLLAGSLSDTEGALTFTIGVLAGPISEAVFAHLLLAFPYGRLQSRAERVLVATAYADVIAVQLLMLLFMDYRSVPGCPCPRNLLFVITNDAVHEFLMTAQRVVGLVVVVGVIVLLARRWRDATPPLRRSLAPVLSTGAVAVALAGASLALTQLSNSSAGGTVSLAATLAIAFVPVGFWSACSAAGSPGPPSVTW